MTHKEIGEALGLSKTTVRDTEYRAMAKLLKIAEANQVTINDYVRDDKPEKQNEPTV